MANRRHEDTPSIMMLINTIFFGVAVGLVFYLWIIFAKGEMQSKVASLGGIDSYERLFISTIAILFAGFFHSILILHPEYREKKADLVRTKMQFDGLRNMAMRDPLTEIHNRRYFEGSLNAFIEVFSQRNQSFGLLIVDLDHFKQVNDTYGHDAGDHVLKEVSEALLNCSRDYDVVARFGGEEFAVIAPTASQTGLLNMGERLRAALETKKIRYKKQNISISASIGTALFTKGMTAKDLLLLADEKLYQAKERGRNQVAA